jgi:hypothetical protein
MTNEIAHEPSKSDIRAAAKLQRDAEVEALKQKLLLKIVPAEVSGAIEKILDHYVRDEERHHFECSDPIERPNHILHSLLVVRRWLEAHVQLFAPASNDPAR